MLTEALLPVYPPMPVVPVRGRGSWLIDARGDAWLDAYGGHAVAATGHSHPEVVRAIQEQAAELLFYSTAVELPQRARLAEELARLCPGDLERVFFCNSGAEANENALHVARRVTGRQRVVAVEGGWHGRTVATLAVTTGIRYETAAERAGMPIAPRVPFDDVASLERLVTGEVAALIVEPVQGMAGARACAPEFLQAARDVCDRRGALLIFDEVQCGVARCGAFTAAESYGVTPDALTLAKGLAAGLPIGALIVRPHVAASLAVGDLGSTFGGGPVPCAAALANLGVIERDGLVDNAVRIGARIRAGALKLGARNTDGRGLLIGLRFERPAADLQRALWELRILTGTANDPHVLRLMPPLNFSPAEADQLLDGLAQILA